ncbi:MAG: rhomboid family intramembrane serine protease [Lactobacillus sp.]|jgi:rhomboid protease GluP
MTNFLNRFRWRSETFVTYWLLAVLVAVFVAQCLTGGFSYTNLLRFGAMANPLVAVREQWWRLFTAQFLHMGILHLATNAVMIYYMGNYLERILGHWRFALVYLLAGIGGNLASFAWGADNAVAGGASTALFGLFGAMAALGVLNRDQPALRQLGQQSFALAAINIAIDLFMPNIDIWGHLGGFIAGTLLCLLVGSGNWRTAKWPWRLLATILLAVYVIVCLRQGLMISY